MLLKNSDDLLFGKAAALHILVLPMGQNKLQSGLERGGNVTGHSSLAAIGLSLPVMYSRAAI